MSEKLQNLINRFLRREIAVEDFQVQFYGLYFQVRNGRIRGDASRICDAVVLPLAEFSNHHRSERSLREELANAIRPFANNSVLLMGDVRFLNLEDISRTDVGRETHGSSATFETGRDGSWPDSTLAGSSVPPFYRAA
jgi:hypothetical protein